MNCDQCSQPIAINAILDSEVWEAIADGDYALCPLCIDSRLAARGLTAECDLQFSGEALRSAPTPRSIRMAGAWRLRPSIQPGDSVGLLRLFANRRLEGA